METHSEEVEGWEGKGNLHRIGRKRYGKAVSVSGLAREDLAAAGVKMFCSQGQAGVLPVRQRTYPTSSALPVVSKVESICSIYLRRTR